MNVQYARAWKWRDCAWWYNERTYVGLLAAAAWQIGGHSLEEYATRKRQARSPHYAGRGDLYFELKGTRYIAEAKHEWVPLGRRSRKIPNRLDRLLRRARNSVIDAETKKGTKLGLLFIAPMVPIRQRDDAAALVSWLVSTVREEVSYGAVAWVFPKEAKSLVYRDYVYPGVALLILAD